MVVGSTILLSGTDEGKIGGPWPHLGVPSRSTAQRTSPVRVALVDDEASMHKLVEKTLKKFARGWLLDSFFDGRQALSQIPMFPPDVVLMDIKMPGIKGVECARRLKQALPKLPIVMLSAYVDAETLLNAMMAGASGCLFKPAPAPEIIRALKKTLAGGMAFCTRSEATMLECLQMLGHDCNGWELTPREYDIMIGVCQQKLDTEIAEELGIGAGTVHVHLSRIFKKLGVHNRVEAMRKILSVHRPKL